MTGKELKMLQSLPLDIKVAKTKLRIEEWVRHYGIEGVYISFSGGKDSTVLVHIARQLFPELECVFVDTGLEYPEIKEFVRKFDNITILRPTMSFKQVIEKYGYPMTSKEQAHYLHRIRNGGEEVKAKILAQEGKFVFAKRWHYLMDAPFKISDKCCTIMKKNPSREYQKKTGKVRMDGMMACESKLREQTYLESGCNAFDNVTPRSMPLGFWTEADIIRYIKENNVEIASVYGDIVEENGKLRLTGLDRSGCVFCGFGIDNPSEREFNRYQKLELTHPKLHKYCMETLGFEEVCQYMDIPFNHLGEDALLYES